MVPRLKEMYYSKIVPLIMKQHNLKNNNEVPGIEKIILNVGVGEAKDNPKLLNSAAKELTAIAGQKAVITRAKKSISNFKLRKGMAIGAKVTLRGNRMWEFFDRLVNVALPRVRDFRGLSLQSFDKFNNYSIGIKEQIIFPEIDYDKVERIHGMDITFVIKNRKKHEVVKDFLESIGMPFRKIDPKELEAKKAAEEDARKRAEAVKAAAEADEEERAKADEAKKDTEATSADEKKSGEGKKPSEDAKEGDKKKPTEPQKQAGGENPPGPGKGEKKKGSDKKEK